MHHGRTAAVDGKCCWASARRKIRLLHQQTVAGFTVGVDTANDGSPRFTVVCSR
jgi:hypothetical protein